MPKTSTRFPPEKIEAMRKELLEGGKTLKEIGDREGVSREWIRRLVGNLNRGHSRFEAQLERVKLLAEAGRTDSEIAAEIRLAPGTVQNYRHRMGIKQPRIRKYTRESAIASAIKWHRLFGYTPASADWNTSFSIKRGDVERAQRFFKFREEFGCPATSQVQKMFGSWSEFIRQTGLTPASVGARGHGRWRID